MTERYHSPLYLRLKAKAEAAFEAERQEEPMAHGHMPTRARLTYLKHHLETIERGETPKGIGPQQGEILALVRMALNPEDANFTDPLAEPEYEVVIPRGVTSMRIRIAKRGEAPKLVMEGGRSTAYFDGKPTGGGRGGVSTPYVEPITPAIPAEPDLWPEDPRAPEGADGGERAAADFEVGDWVISTMPGVGAHDDRAYVVERKMFMRGRWVIRLLGHPQPAFLFDEKHFRRATDLEIIDAAHA